MRLNPLKWARNLTFLALLMLDFQHTYEFILSLSSGTQAHELVPLFGPLFDWMAIPMTNGVFDALAYAYMVTATIYFTSNTIAKRLSHNHPVKLLTTALVVGTALSALTNAGTMYYGATSQMIIPAALVGPTAALLGGVITCGLLMFASMDAWDMKARIEKGRATRARNQQTRDEVAAARAKREKYTPKKFKTAQA